MEFFQNYLFKMVFFNIFFHGDVKKDLHKNFSSLGQFWKNGLLQWKSKSLNAFRSTSTPPSGLKFLVWTQGPIRMMTPSVHFCYPHFEKFRPTLMYTPFLFNFQQFLIITYKIVFHHFRIPTFWPIMTNYDLLSPFWLPSCLLLFTWFMNAPFGRRNPKGKTS